MKSFSATGPPTTSYRFGPVNVAPPSSKVWHEPHSVRANVAPVDAFAAANSAPTSAGASSSAPAAAPSSGTSMG